MCSTARIHRRRTKGVSRGTTRGGGRGREGRDDSFLDDRIYHATAGSYRLDRSETTTSLDKQAVIEISNFKSLLRTDLSDPFLRSLISYEKNWIREVCDNWEVERVKRIGIGKFIRFIEISNFKFQIPISNRFTIRSLISYKTNGIREICNNWEMERKKGIGIQEFIRYKGDASTIIEISNFKSLFWTVITDSESVPSITNSNFISRKKWDKRNM